MLPCEEEGIVDGAGLRRLPAVISHCTGSECEAEDPDDDASLVAAGYASLTPIVGVREETGPRADGLLEAAMRDVEQFLS